MKSGVVHVVVVLQGLPDNQGVIVVLRDFLDDNRGVVLVLQGLFGGQCDRW